MRYGCQFFGSIMVCFEALLQAETPDFDTWNGAARRLDLAEGITAWRQDPASSVYDSKLIRDRIHEMKAVSCRSDLYAYNLIVIRLSYFTNLQLEEKGDIQSIMYWLRSGLMRNLGNLTDARLFEPYRTSTKAAVHEHQRLVAALFQRVCYCDDAVLQLQARLSFFLECRYTEPLRCSKPPAHTRRVMPGEKE